MTGCAAVTRQAAGCAPSITPDREATVQHPKRLISRGAIAGILAASALAIWFLIVDALRGEPFGTPAFLAGGVLGIDAPEPNVLAVVLYTLVHYAAFVVAGIAVAIVLGLLNAAPSFLLGLVLGMLLFDVLFYLSVLVTGVDMVRALGWPEVLVGNLLAGITLMAYLHLTAPLHLASWVDFLREHRATRDGIIAGLIGAGAVAVWFLVLDAAEGRIFFTPAALGSAILHGAASTQQVVIDPGTVLGYTIVHVTAFVLIGMIAAVLVKGAEHEPRLVLAMVLLFVTFETLFIGLLAIAALWLLDALRWWTIAIGNIIAATAMGFYLWHKHPALRRQLRKRPFEELEEPVT